MKVLRVSQEKKIWFMNCYANICLGYIEVERENFSQAIDYLEKAKHLYEKSNFILHDFHDNNFIYLRIWMWLLFEKDRGFL